MSNIIKAVLIDISGTIVVGQDAIPGAIKALQRLQQQQNLKILFLTNSSTSPVALLQQLRSAGFYESAIPNINSIMTSVSATRNYLLQNKLRPYCLIEDALIESEFAKVDMNDPNCVVVGLAPNKLNYQRLNEAYRLLAKLKSSSDDYYRPHLIAVSKATHFLDADRELSLGPGRFVSLLEQSSDVTAHVIGKPSSNFYNEALSVIGIDDPSQALMVGDDVVGDVKGALDAGLGHAILVKTGKYTTGDENGNKTEGILPTLTVDIFALIVKILSISSMRLSPISFQYHSK